MASTTAVMGAGAWGTTLAKVLVDAGGEVALWARRSQLAEEINATRHNAKYLPGVQLPTGVRATGDAEEALQRGVDGTTDDAGADDADQPATVEGPVR